MDAVRFAFCIRHGPYRKDLSGQQDAENRNGFQLHGEQASFAIVATEEQRPLNDRRIFQEQVDRTLVEKRVCENAEDGLNL